MGIGDVTEGSTPKVVNPKARHNSWSLGVEQLKKQEGDSFSLINALDREPLSVLIDILKATNDKKDECLKKRWKVVIKGRAIILRDILEKISVWVDRLLVRTIP
ncbi:hypothetical protein F5Y05DRAFT_45349 [Hypoxylon sp. FL0543]|nr:hypothetical protein F5Y05DRAFT_45349 [Hypoxylon sp. FL0543]